MELHLRIQISLGDELWNCRREVDRVSLHGQLQTEQSEHVASRQQHAAGLQELHIQIGNLKARLLSINILYALS